MRSESAVNIVVVCGVLALILLLVGVVLSVKILLGIALLLMGVALLAILSAINNT